MEQTAVEKLIEKYNNLWEYHGMGSAISFSKVVSDLEKLKKKEEEQMIEFANEYSCAVMGGCLLTPTEFYNETFKSE